MTKQVAANLLDIEHVYTSLKEQVARVLSQKPGLALVGIHSGGVWVAERLHADLKIQVPLGCLSSAFHRDDYSRRGLPAEMKSTTLPFEIAGTHILLVDDILFTGRTVRAVELAVLLDRGGRELPVEAQYCGAKHPLAKNMNFILERSADMHFVLSLEGDR
jgi:pyrimidine operon attenuation protein / uracil phosphoribosyltransferase